jgi:hypothetical protein
MTRAWCDKPHIILTPKRYDLRVQWYDPVQTMSRIPLLACFPRSPHWVRTLGLWQHTLQVWLYHSNTSTTDGDGEILQTGGYYPHLHTANCLQRFHCSQGESLRSYRIKSPTYQTSNFREIKLLSIILMHWQGIKENNKFIRDTKNLNKCKGSEMILIV